MFFKIVHLARKKILHLFPFILTLCLPGLVYSQPTFSLSFSPSTIGPGSVSTLQFDITNPDPSAVTDMAFTNNLPAGVTVAIPAQAESDCDGTLTAPDGESTMSLSDGIVGASGSCTITVNVTSSTVATHTNNSISLTSSAETSSSSEVDLIVATDRPGFSKSFPPGASSLGGRTTLTFIIDNTANPDLATNLAFSDTLPMGLLVADPANASTTCEDYNSNPDGGIITAVPGSSVISFSSGSGFDRGTVAAEATCSVSVDVIATSVGSLGNVTDELTSSLLHATSHSSGKASAILEVTADALHIDTSFTNDPIAPEGSVDLEFSITNFDRTNPATNISFTDNLDDTLPGLAANALPLNEVCGAGSQISGTSTLTLTGGNLAPVSTCTFSVTLNVPTGAVSGVYANTTSTVTADIDGSQVAGGAATESLFIQTAPLLTKTYLDADTLADLDYPVAAGDDVVIQYSITNTSSTFPASDINFIEDLTTFLPFPVSVTLPSAGFCGPDSEMMSLVNLDDSWQRLSLTKGELAAGNSCVFEVTVTLPLGLSAGSHTLYTEEIYATVDEEIYMGNPASDILLIASSPSLTKAFTDDPVAPGDPVTLEFTLSYPEEASSDATDITFTDDLSATLSGLAAADTPKSDICGSGSQISGTSTLSFTGGSLSPGESCTFSVSLAVPAGATSGNHTNSTSDVSATVEGITVAGSPAEDDLHIADLSLSKEFTNDPVIPGDTVTLEFTLENTSPTVSATDIEFTDNLSDVLSGLSVVSGLLPLSDICGAGSQISGTSTLSFSGGSLDPATSCSFSITLDVPSGAASNTYLNTTSDISAFIDDNPVTLDPATDSLVIDANLLHLSKSFTDDPVNPGETVNLAFTLTNQHTSKTATDIGFTDDLDAALSGLVASGLTVNDICGAGSQISGTSTLSFSGGSLDPGQSCTFNVELQVPADLKSGTVATNTTSQVTGIIDSLAVTGDPATDELEVGFLTLDKSYSGTTRAGEMVTLNFILQNNNSVSAVSDLAFSDNLGNVLPGLVATGLPQSDVCGPGSLLSGGGIITFSSGNLGPDESCTFSVNLLVPLNAPHGFFTNTTSDLTIQGESVASPATATLEVDNDPDNDGILDKDDNCPDSANPDQKNNDGDSQGDVCDLDDDNDTVPDTSDNCRFAVNTDQANFDGDGTGDICDRDDDNDGMRDSWEIENGLDPYDPSDALLDNDNDGYTNFEEHWFNSDPFEFDSDDDNNGVPDRIDGVRGNILSIYYLLTH